MGNNVNRGWAAIGALLAGTSALVGCSGPQSTLDPAGRGAARIAELFWGMTAGAVVIWAAMMGLALYTVARRRTEPSPRAPGLLIVGGGVVLPIVVLTGLLAWGLAALPPLLAASDSDRTIAVTGEQFWWRVRYLVPGGEAVELANELRLPVGEAVELQLESRDVIHSFWVPALGGKVDMIPGRRTRLTLEPTRTGVFRGVCAEYCGTSHARMAFAVVVSDEQEFARWLAQQAEPARPATEPLAVRGQELFVRSGCGACHTVRGTVADGVIAPDLTHVGGRLSVGAGLLASEPDGFQHWIAAPDRLKPGSAMPSFAMLPTEDLQALAAYLEGLE
jgi:cytochrome c oxidase subunit 2